VGFAPNSALRLKNYIAELTSEMFKEQCHKALVTYSKCNLN